MQTLREARESRGSTQTAVAKHLGVSRQTYCSYENNPSKISIMQAKAICKMLGYELGDIFFDSDVKITNNR